MSGMCFHKSVYTARSSGYKYRTLATNTEGKTIDEVTQTLKIGEKKRRDVKEDNIFDRRFQDLKQVITSKIDQQFDETRRAREMLMDKLTKVSAKIDTMLEFQNTVKSLRKDLTAAENTLADLQERVEKLDIFSESSNSTLLYLPGAGFNMSDTTRDVFQQRGEMLQLFGGDYFTNNLS